MSSQIDLERDGFSIRTQLTAAREAVWAAVSRIDQINRELAPYLKMTAPRQAADQTVENVPLNQPAFTSVILLFGVVPVDLHFVSIAERDDGWRFLERSSSVVSRRWSHERVLEVGPVAGTCSVTDRISFRSRVPGVDRVIAPAVRALFVHRHRRLIERFGAASVTEESRPTGLRSST